MVWTHARISWAVSKTHSPWWAVFIGSAAPLLPATGWGDSTGAGASVGDTFTFSNLPSRPWTTCLALRHCLHSSSAKGRTRSEVMFQWLVEGTWGLASSFGPASGPGETSPTHIREDMRCSYLENEGKGYYKPTPLWVAGSRQYRAWSPEGKRRHRLISVLHCLLGCHIQ